MDLSTAVKSNGRGESVLLIMVDESSEGVVESMFVDYNAVEFVAKGFNIRILETKEGLSVQTTFTRKG